MRVRLTFLPGLIALLLTPTTRTVAQEQCLTPTDKAGSCVNIRECQSLIEILRGPRPLSVEDLEFLRNSQCGFEGTHPKVCCETQVQTSPEITEPPDVSNHPNLRLLSHDVCGPVTEQKIFGGNKTGVFDFPWMALLAYNTGKPTPEYRCSGTVISKRYILTAAHCVTSLQPGLSLTGVRVGDHDIKRERDCDRDATGIEVVCAERYQDFGIESTHFHPGYTMLKLQNDIALLRLDADIDFRPQSARPICLPIGTAATLAQKKVVVTGWGATELGRRSDILLRVQLSPVSIEQCMQAYNGRVQIWYKQLCAGGKRSMDSCLGDSGGPLQAPGIYYNRVRYIQYGIVSFGLTSCGTEGVPGVYTNVTHYMDWVLDTMRE